MSNKGKSKSAVAIYASPDATVKQWDADHARTLKTGDAAHRTALAKLKIWFPQIERAV
jgi:hypothetical protein